MNNPLIYTDPSGEFIWFVIGGAIIGSYIGGSISAGDGGLANANWNSFGGKQRSWKGTDWWKGAIVGGIAGAGALAATAIGGPATQALILGGPGNGASLGWSITSSSLTAGNLQMGVTGIATGGDIDAMWKAGFSGLASGAIRKKENFYI